MFVGGKPDMVPKHRATPPPAQPRCTGATGPSGAAPASGEPLRAGPPPAGLHGVRPSLRAGRVG
eukprot:10326602-Lingulodinium_polyedra.AAC.1